MGEYAVLRWGILGAGRVTTAVLAALDGSDGNVVDAVASRDGVAAGRLAARFDVPRVVAGYMSLVEDPDIDAVYVATPNALHAKWVQRALEAGKHVLCEKPLGLTADEVLPLFELARRHGRLLSEAFMYRHQSQIRRLTQLVAAGAIGNLQLIRTCYSFPLADQGDIRLNRELGGGAVMDIGCYCINLSRLLAGRPTAVFGHALMHGAGVDERFMGLLQFDGGAVAQFDCGFTMPIRHEAEVVGDAGSIRLLDPWMGSAPVILIETAAGTSEERLPAQNPYLLEFEDFRSAVTNGGVPLVGATDAVENAQTIDALRRSVATGTRVSLGSVEGLVE